MLGKLLKYDIKNMAKLLIPIYLVLICVSLVTKGFSYIATKVTFLSYISTFATAFLIILLIGTFFYTVFLSIKKYYREVFKDESYLTHTLPVKKIDILSSKLIASIIFIMITVIVIIVSLIITFGTSEFNNLLNDLSMMASELSISTFALYSILALIIFFAFIATILGMYLAISIGHMSNKDKIMYSFIAYIGVYGVSQLIGVIGLGIMYLCDRSIIDYINVNIVPLNLFRNIIITAISISLLQSTIYYIANINILKKRINIE